MPSKSPRETLKPKSRFKVGQDVWIKAKITKIREDDLGLPQLVVNLPHGMAPVRVREGDAEPVKPE